MTSLADLPVGQRGVVREVQGQDEVTLRLLEMGVTPGVEVEIIGVAPLGDPLELELRGYRLSLRMSEAGRISVDQA